MNLFDTHVHFSGLEGDYTLALQLARAEAAEAYPERIRAAIGFDRDQAVELGTPPLVEDALDRLRRSVSTLRSLGAVVCAIGEIGLDYHYRPATAAAQRALFEAQCGLAAELGLPVVVHSREADADTLDVLEACAGRGRRGGGVAGLLHCFTGGHAFADRLLAAGFMISFSGIVTFANADPLREVARRIPDDRLLVETDSPYLAPVPHRGWRNEPAFAREVASVLARVRGSSLEALAAQTAANANRLFGAW